MACFSLSGSGMNSVSSRLKNDKRSRLGRLSYVARMTCARNSVAASPLRARNPLDIDNSPGGGVGRRAGTGPPHVGACECPPAPELVAIRAGRLFDSRNGQMLTNQVVLLMGERITDVGPQSQVKIPAGARVIDLSRATVVPGLIDAHTPMFSNRRPGGSPENSMLVAISNVQTNLLAGFTAARDMSTHGNGY